MALAPTASQVTSLDDDCRLVRLSPETLQLVADFFKVLSESSRLQIVCALKTGQKNVTEIIEATGLGQANVSKHLKILAQAGIVKRQQQGVCVYYQIANGFVFELCELVCDSLSVQIQQQSEQIAHLGAFRQA
ncbi:metalloregulator ArsR/SmtB family transcription factor [Leptolyngbya sp. CCNP1308]|uniref:ArsR/SmtB family transcription factor n=1 Tax=Leptolyngbya sp. CCNP1308 TaxID=3110255 RepID=UPI002B1FAA1E|nr:metalloregulator ArsR/SmtB family transcription factor [Leptolyngbya sp. CCNP1308]MEA5450058.1 metalloregulator ArsR/SmtB family transcription factor [Leptolyngbya sp. CCNP1308]